MVQQIIFALLFLSIVIPFGVYFISKKKNFKKALGINILTFFGVLIIGTVVVFTQNVSAATEVADASSKGLGYIAAALAVGMSGIGGGIAVSASASAAIGALSENEGIMGKAIIFVALAEGVALYGLLIAFMILNQL